MKVERPTPDPGRWDSDMSIAKIDEASGDEPDASFCHEGVAMDGPQENPESQGQREVRKPPPLPPAPVRIGGRPVVVVRYPNPPALYKRLIFLCLKPEAWADAARYPLWNTMLVALLAVILSGLMTGIGIAHRTVAGIEGFAAQYDKFYPPLVINSDGVLSTKGELKEPIRVNNGPGTLVIDPSDRTTLDSITTPVAMLITSKDVHTRNVLEGSIPIKEYLLLNLLVPKAGEATEINGTTMTRWITSYQGWIYILWGGLIAFVTATIQGLWTLLMMVIVAPLVMIGAATPGKGRMIIPKFIAYRVAIAVAVPLVILDGLLEGLGYSVRWTLGQMSSLFFLLAVSALAFWAGVLAKWMFGIAANPNRK